MRDNIKSANIVAFNNPTGQNEYDFFKYQMANHVNPVDDFKFKLLLKKFKTASNCVAMVGQGEFGKFENNGSPINSYK